MFTTVLLALSLLTPVAQAQDARQLLADARAKQLERVAAVDNFTIIQTVNGLALPLYFEKIGAGGSTAFRSVPMTEWLALDTASSRALMQGMATGTRLLSRAFRTPGQTGDMTVGPMNDIMAGMLDSMAIFADFAANAVVDIGDGRAEAADERAGMATFARQARLIGEESVNGRRSFLLRASDLGITSTTRTAGTAFTFDSISVWLDAAELVPLRLTLEGKMIVERRTVPITMEQISLDHRHFGPLFEPQRQIMRISGLMEALSSDPRQQRELEQARRGMERTKSDMARMQTELARLPEAQRRMVEDRMNQALAQLESLLNGNMLQMEVQRTVHAWNKGPPTDWRFGRGGAPRQE